MKEHELTNCISGLGRLGADWSELPPSIRRSLGDAFLRTLRDLSAKGLAMAVHGLGRMNADFHSLPANFRSSIMSAIHKIAPRLNAVEVSNILYGLGKMGTKMYVEDEQHEKGKRKQFKESRNISSNSNSNNDNSNGYKSVKKVLQYTEAEHERVQSEASALKGVNATRTASSNRSKDWSSFRGFPRGFGDKSGSASNSQGKKIRIF